MNVLAVFAHPDDETLACGGTLAKHAEAGDRVGIVIYARPEHTGYLRDSAKVLGGDSAHMHYPDQSLDAVKFTDLTARLTGDADVIYTHHPHDLNLDHELVARAVLTAFRPKPGARPCTILACETLSSTEWGFGRPAFEPNWFEALTEGQLQRKLDALACYPTEVERWPHPRSKLGVRNLAAVRGQQVGVERAEAFQLLRRGPL